MVSGLFRVCFFILCFQSYMSANELSPKIGVVVTAFNRPGYLKQTLESLQAKSLGIDDHNIEIVIIDDCSDPEAESLIDSFHFHEATVIRLRVKKNSGIASALDSGWSILYSRGCSYLCNLDADVLLGTDWLGRLLETYETSRNALGIRCSIVTGFNTLNHLIKEERPTFYIKKTVGGINLFFPRSLYPSSVKEALKMGNAWDWALVEIAKARRIPFICTKPSVIQHIGIDGMNSNKTAQYDYAEDFEG